MPYTGLVGFIFVVYYLKRKRQKIRGRKHGRKQQQQR
jgi:hypothetical protein